MVAFDKDSGKVLWKATDDEAGYSSPAAATVAGRRCILSFTCAGLVALGPADGSVLFSFPWRSRLDASVNAATPLVNRAAGGAAGDEIFLTASYGTGAVLLKAGKAGGAAKTIDVHKVWASDESLSCHYATPVYRDGFLYGYHGRQESGPDLRCVEWATGKVRWSEDHFGAGSMVLAGDKLLILTERGQLLLAPATPDGFKPLAKAQVLPFECRAYPALAGLFMPEARTPSSASICTGGDEPICRERYHRLRRRGSGATDRRRTVWGGSPICDGANGGFVAPANPLLTVTAIQHAPDRQVVVMMKLPVASQCPHHPAASRALEDPS